jgi:hypothetical protein
MKYLNKKDDSMSLRLQACASVPSGNQQPDLSLRGATAPWQSDRLLRRLTPRNDKSRGFALLYAILIIFLFMITVSAVMFSALADIRQYNQAKSSLGALMAAQSGIEVGLASKTIDSCGNTTPVNINGGSDTSGGFYVVKVCVVSPDNYIESTGIYSGVKMKLKAESINNPTNLKIYQVGI